MYIMLGGNDSVAAECCTSPENGDSDPIASYNYKVLTSHITGAVGESGRKASLSRVHTVCHACVGTHLCMRVYVCTL